MYYSCGKDLLILVSKGLCVKNCSGRKELLETVSGERKEIRIRLKRPVLKTVKRSNWLTRDSKLIVSRHILTNSMK